MKNQTPLHFALKNNLPEIGKLLISKGIDINTFDEIYLKIMVLFELLYFKINKNNPIKLIILHFTMRQ